MVTIQKAAENAVVFARTTLGEEFTNAIRLEELESSAESGHDTWLITLSMLVPVHPEEGGGLLGALAKRKRLYKTFTVLKETGQVTAMKIRELADA